MDHRVRVASIAFWSIFLINILVVVYTILQYTFASPLFGDIETIFIAGVNAIVAVIAAIGMGVHESYRI